MQEQMATSELNSQRHFVEFDGAMLVASRAEDARQALQDLANDAARRAFVVADALI